MYIIARLQFRKKICNFEVDGGGDEERDNNWNALLVGKGDVGVQGILGPNDCGEQGIVPKICLEEEEV